MPIIKQRLKIWAIILIAAAILTIVKPAITDFVTDSNRTVTTFTVSISDMDNLAKSNFADIDEKYKFTTKEGDKLKMNFKYVSNIDNNKPDIIIKKASVDNAPKQNYTYHHNLFYSPIVCWASSNTLSYSEFEKLEDKDNNYFIDIAPVFDALLNGQTWKDLDNHGFKKDITIVIPEKDNVYYEEVRNFIKLNMSKDDNMSDKDQENKVDKIIEKCKSTDVANLITKEFPENYIVIAPESYYADSKSGVIPAYAKHTNAVMYDVYIKNDTKNINDKTFDINDNIVKFYKNSRSFFTDTTIRINNYNYKFHKGSMSSLYYMYEHLEIEYTKNKQ